MRVKGLGILSVLVIGLMLAASCLWQTPNYSLNRTSNLCVCQLDLSLYPITLSIPTIIVEPIRQELKLMGDETENEEEREASRRGNKWGNGRKGKLTSLECKSTLGIHFVYGLYIFSDTSPPV